MSVEAKIEIGPNCLVCYEDLDDETKVLFQDKVGGEWKQAAYCYDCCQILLNTLWEKYENDVKKADCRRALRRAIQEGPPINIRDIGFPCDNESKEVIALKCKETEFSPKLKGSLEGEERQKWWDHYKTIMEAMEETTEEITKL